MFTIRTEQMAALRKQRIGDGLARSFEGTRQKGSLDPASGDVVITDPVGRSLRCTFDERGFIGTVVGPLGRTYHLENDARGRLLGLTMPSGLRLALSRDTTGRITSVTRGRRKLFDLAYDPETQRLATMTFSDQTRCEIRYASPTQVASFVDRLGGILNFDYDADRRLRAIVDPNGNRTSIGYASHGRPDKVTYATGSTESYEYDSAGRVRRIVSGAEVLVDIRYDDADRPVQLVYGDGETIRFTYDEKGKVVQAVSPEATVRYEHNGDERLVKEDLGGQVVEYHYDDCLELVGITYPSGDRVTFGRDAEQRLTSVFDWAGGRHEIRYAPDEQGYEHVFPSGLVARTRLADTGQPLKVTVRAPGAWRDLFALRYGYDDEGRLSAFTDSDFGSQSYTYDAENQLLSVRSDLGRADDSFTYDLTGNRASSGGTRAEFNTQNQLISQGVVRCAYDDRGNLVSYSDGRRVWRLTYNSRNLLIRADSRDGRRVTFGYDPFGRRLWKRSDGLNVRYLWAGEHLIGEVSSQGGRTESREYLYLPGSHTPLAVRVGKEVYAYHTDRLGTPRRLTDASGKVVWSADYTAYGLARVVVEEVRNPLRFPGQQWDPETGFHYNRFRYYSPVLGRYLTSDPLRYLAGVNFYSYADNNPIEGCDPLGLLSLLGKIAVGCVAAGVGLLAVGLVVATGGAATPLVIIGAAALAGAVGGGLGSVLDQKEHCATCPIDWGKVALSAGIGFLAGAAGAAAALAVAPAVMAVAGAGGIGLSGVGLGVATGAVTGAFGGAVGGAVSYATGVAVDPNAKFDWNKCADAAFEGEVGGAIGGGILGGVMPPGEYPGRTPESDAAANQMAETMNESGVGVNRGKAVTAITHEDGSVSVGTSGSSKDAAYVADKTAGNLPDNYTVGKDMANPDALEPAQYPNGNAVASKTCAETRAWQATQNNPSPPTGQTTIWRGDPSTNPYPVEPNSSVMNPCPSCAKNAGTIMGEPKPVGGPIGAGSAPHSGSSEEPEE